MNLTLTRNEKIITAVGLFVCVCVLVSLSQINKKPKAFSQIETRDAINYEMARPEEGFVGYSLDQREIEDEYHGLNTKKDLKAATGQKLAQPKADPKKLVAKPQAKPAQQKAAQKSAAAKNASPATVAQVQRIPQTSPGSDKAETTTTASADAPAISYPDSGSVAQQAPEAPAATPDKEAKNKKSFAQWRSEIFAKPTKETMALFIGAFRKNEVTSTEFQAMAQDLVEQNDQNLKGLGLMALRSHPSLESLSQLVVAQEKVAAPLQAYIEQAYLAYVQPQHLGIFNQVFQTKNKKLIVKSLAVLGTNIQKIKNGETSGFVDPRQRRDSEQQALSVGMFKSLLPMLALVSSTNEPDVAALAQQVAALIQSNTQVAGL